MFGIGQLIQNEIYGWQGKVEVEVVRGTFAGTPVLRAYDKGHKHVYLAKDVAGTNPGQARWTEKVDRRWWDSVKGRTCGD